MAKQTVIDWQKDSLLIASASGRVGNVSIDAISNIELEGTSAAEGLSKGIAELGLGKTPVTVVAERASAEVRTINVPRVDAAELPGIIRFQAQRQLANMGENWALDYVLLPDNGQEMQTALVGAMAPDHLARVEKSCTKAGLQLEHVALRPIEIARHALNAGGGSRKAGLIVCVSEGAADLILTQQGQVVLIRNTNLPGEPEQLANALAGEIRRSMLAASGQIGGEGVESTVLMCASEIADSVKPKVADATGTPVTVVDLTETLPAGLDTRTALAKQHANRIAGICGAATMPVSDTALTLDFKNPKKAPPPKSNVLTYILAAAAVLILVGGGITWWIQTNKDLDNQIATLEAENEESKGNIGRAMTKISQVSEIEKFTKGSPQFLDEFARLTDKVPGSDKIILAGPQFITQPDGEGQIRVNIAADTDKSISEFEASLRDENHKVSARDMQESKRPTKLYKWEAVETITIVNSGWNVVKDTKASAYGSAKPAEDEAKGDKPAEEEAEDSTTESAEKAATETNDTDNSDEQNSDTDTAKSSTASGKSADEGDEKPEAEDAGETSAEGTEETAEVSEKDLDAASEDSTDAAADNSEEPAKSAEEETDENQVDAQASAGEASNNSEESSSSGEESDNSNEPEAASEENATQPDASKNANEPANTEVESESAEKESSEASNEGGQK
ncbi:MAG: hypothetical protein AAF483_22245 [Planctomycetota bacterium]